MNRLTKKILSVASLTAVIVLSSACAATPVAPEAALADAREAIASAEQAGARQHAGAELDEAQQKLLLAEESVSNEKMIDAERLAYESMVVAELASARTESVKAAKINKEMDRSADALSEELQRAGDQ